MRQYIPAVLILLITVFINPLYADDSDLIIKNAWIAEAPPVSKVMAAYMTINNTGKTAIDIIKAESDEFSSIEFHETVYHDGMAKMVRYDEITVPSNDSVQFKRGAIHFMLFNPRKRLKAGDAVSIKLTTKNSATKTISVTVKKAQY